MLRISTRLASIMERYRRLRPVTLDQPVATPASYPKIDRFDATSLAGGSLSYIRSPVPAHAKLFFPAEAISQPANPKRLRVALIGAPNAGKTSFLNKVLGEQIGAVSAKKNTTRESISGVLTRDNVQVEFVDCPGIVPYDGSLECKELSAEAWKNLNDSDLILLIVDTVKKPSTDFLEILRKIGKKQNISDELKQFKESNENAAAKPVVLVLNKMDLVRDKKWLKIRNLQLSAHAAFESCFFVSAKEGRGTDKLISYLCGKALPGDWQFSSDTTTTLSMTGQLEQLVRSFLYTWFNKDVPYKVQQQTVGWTERLDGTLVVEHELIVEDSVVARMILGTKNRLVQRLKENAEFKLKNKWKLDKLILLIHVKARKQRLSKRDKLENAKLGNMHNFVSRGAGR